MAEDYFQHHENPQFNIDLAKNNINYPNGKT
jgi:hypothetical protein